MFAVAEKTNWFKQASSLVVFFVLLWVSGVGGFPALPSRCQKSGILVYSMLHSFSLHSQHLKASNTVYDEVKVKV